MKSRYKIRLLIQIIAATIVTERLRGFSQINYVMNKIDEVFPKLDSKSEERLILHVMNKIEKIGIKTNF